MYCDGIGLVSPDILYSRKFIVLPPSRGTGRIKESLRVHAKFAHFVHEAQR